MTYFLKQSDWMSSLNNPEGMNLQMLNDSSRVDLILKPGIEKSAPGKIVVDLGCGTGALGLYALSCQASFVYFVEADPQMFHILSNVLPNKLAPGTFKLIHKDIQSLVAADFDQGTPEVVVSEFYGPRLFDEGYVAYSAHMRSMFPECFFVPEIFRVTVCKVEPNFTMYPWPDNRELDDHFKFMYREKGFAGGIPLDNHMINPVQLGVIEFNANTQEFVNSCSFKVESDIDCMIYGLTTVHNSDSSHQPKSCSTFGWWVDKDTLPANFTMYFDENYNPRISRCS